MDKRKAYIITAIIVLALIAGLALWYLYLARKDAQQGQTTTLNTKDYNVFTPSNAKSTNIDKALSKQNRKTTATTTIQSQATSSELYNEGSASTTTPQQESWRLVQVHEQAVAGMVPTTDGENSYIRYIDKKTGHMLESTTNLDKKRFIGITSKMVGTAHFITNNEVLLTHTNGMEPTIIKTNTKSPSKSSIPNTVKQINIINNIPYYLLPNSLGGVSLMMLGNSGTQELWSSQLTGWVMQTINNSTLVTQSPSYGIPGYAYLVQDSRVQPILQDLPGLITNISPDASKILYSTSDKSGTNLYLKDITTTDTIHLTLATLANKCVWGNGSIVLYCAMSNKLPTHMPDVWLKGQTHLTDTLWRINSQTGDALALTKDTGLDMIKLQEGLSKNMVLFINKQDQSLWAVIKNK